MNKLAYSLTTEKKLTNKKDLLKIYSCTTNNKIHILNYN